MLKLLDCTLRDGGYYNTWNFSPKLVEEYLLAMDDLNIDFVEIGFRTLINNRFKGGYAFCSEQFLNSLPIPKGLFGKIGVMINGSEVAEAKTQIKNLEKLFTNQSQSVVSLVRIACHLQDFEDCLPATSWLKEQGYTVGINLMQIADCSLEEITVLAKKASEYPIDVLYFADSMGSLNSDQTSSIITAFQKEWKGDIGIHAHDNMGQAISNSLQAIKKGVTWIDSTVTGMGRGPGNTQTEYLVISVEKENKNIGNPTKLFSLIRKHFKQMQLKYGWGTNPYYYLAGKYGIHPTYIQEMLQDSRYNDEDLIAVIEYLKAEGGKRFSLDTLETARHFYSDKTKGLWEPASIIEGKKILIIGAGPSVQEHKIAIESYINQKAPFVIALNTEQSISENLINVRAACHPIRLLADCNEHLNLQQPLIMPFSMLPSDVAKEFRNKEVFDFGLVIKADSFSFESTCCTIPNSLVISYVLALLNSGKAKEINLVGFDGYSADDPRTAEMEKTLSLYSEHNGIELCSLTPTHYNISTKSIYGL